MRSLLLDREEETRQLSAAVERLSHGHGTTVSITGPAGVGKTRLVSYATEIAGRADVAVASLRCGPLDGDLTGHVMQAVVEALGTSLTASGAAVAQAVPSATFAVAVAAAERPVLIAIDDAHWADPESLRWLAHLAVRVPELQVALVLASRDGEEPTHRAAFDAIAANTAVALRPQALGRAATTAWTVEVVGRAGLKLAESVYGMTAGSPLLIDQLLTDLPTSQRLDEAAVESARPPGLRDMIAARLRRLGDAAWLTAEGVAIFGDEAHVGNVSQLVRLDIDSVAEAAVTLAAAHVLRDGVPLCFAHPLVRAIVYDLIPAARRQLLHRRAAQLLARDKYTLEEGALHLLSVPPLPDEHDAALLVRAGQLAVERNAHGRAARLFERALADALEPACRPEVTLSRARALVLAGEDAGLHAFKEALADIDDPSRVAAVATEAGHALLASGHQYDAVDVYGAAADAAARFDPVLHRRFRAHQCMARLTLRDSAADVIQEVLTPPLPADRAVLALACGVATWMGLPASKLAELADAAMAAGSEETAQGLSWTIDTTFVVLALMWAERFDEARQVLDPIIATARDRGALVDLAAASTYSTYVRFAQGQLSQARSDAELARRVYEGFEDDTRLHGAFELYVLVAMDELDEADARAASLQTRIDAGTAAYIPFLHARAKLHVAQGRLAEARDDLELARDECAARDAVNNCQIPWRSDLARVLLSLGEPKLARDLANEEVTLARAYGAPGTLGRALVAVALADDRRSDALQEALEVLADSSMPLIHADALLQEGIRLRKAGNRHQAQGPLREALDLASRCGARLLARFARSELNACGARPRRERLDGVASLTPSERRIAALAAAGRTNRQIAGELFLTLRTVETHLTSCYRKLGVRARGELGGALGASQIEVEALAGGGDSAGAADVAGSEHATTMAAS